MISVSASSEAEMVYEWLRSEWEPKNFAALGGDPALIANDADLFDPAENQRRRQLLGKLRDPILTPLPPDLTYEKVGVEKGDLDGLYIIPSGDWFLDAGRTFRLEDTLANLRPGRGGDIFGRDESFTHYTDVVARRRRLEERGTDHEFLVLVGDGSGPPYTIIDGTHRASALLQMDASGVETFPWRAILVTSASMNACHWHIASSHAQQLIIALGRAADVGHVW
jgi:hypothetical protein